MGSSKDAASLSKPALELEARDGFRTAAFDQSAKDPPGAYLVTSVLSGYQGTMGKSNRVLTLYIGQLRQTWRGM